MKASDTRVVISGLGVISPNGIGKKAYWDSLKKGTSGVKHISAFDPSRHTTRIAAEVQDFDATRYMDPKKARRMARFSQFALAAARMAKDDAYLEIDRDVPSDEIGVSIGVALNGIEVIEMEHDRLHQKGPGRINPFSAAAALPNSAAGNISVEFGLNGISSTISTGCSAGLNAIGFACDAIRAGTSRMMFAGGTEAAITPLIVGGFCASGSLSRRNDDPEKASRPFDRDRDGFIMGEGACMFVLETLENAIARNAAVYAEIKGYATTSDAYSMVKIDPYGKEAARAMHMAITRSGLNARDIDYVNAHGSSSHMADIRETNAIKQALDDHAYKTPVSSIKSMIGHPFAAAGGLQLAATLMALNEEIIPPTINHDTPDPVCDLDYVAGEARDHRGRNALVNSLGMGGNNASMVVGTCN